VAIDSKKMAGDGEVGEIIGEEVEGQFYCW